MFTPMLRALFTRASPTSLSPLSSPSSSSMYAPTIQKCTKAVSTTSLSSCSSFSLPAGSQRSLHTTSPNLAPKKGKKKRKGKVEERDPRIYNLKSSMPRAVPAPLRFARNRALRHWTIHRAWLLFQGKERKRREHELERMYQSMHNACEELRKTSGPGLREEGYLYRVAMEKKSMYGHNNLPIEYSRAQTETPAREPWNHGWTR